MERVTVAPTSLEQDPHAWLNRRRITALHLPMVMHVGSLHGFMNLYNNGFAGGLAMLIIVGFIKGLRPQWLTDPDAPPLPKAE